MGDKTVRDVMLPIAEYATVHSGCSIKEALVALSKAQLGLTYDRHHHRAVLVLGPDGEVIGKLTHWAILRSLEPEVLSASDHEALARSGLSSDFIASLESSWPPVESLNRLCQAAARIRVRDAMVPARDAIDEDATVVAAIRQMVLGHGESLLVTRQDRVVGLLRLSDIFEEVADCIRETT